MRNIPENITKAIHHRPVKGQSLQEFSVILGLVVVLSVGIVTGLGNQISGFLTRENNVMFGDGTQDSGKVKQLAGLLEKPALQVTGGKELNLPGRAPVTIPLKNGGILQINNVPTNLSEAVNTTSVDGVARQLADTLKATATALEQSKEVTPEQANFLRNLANQGHYMAALQQSVVSAAESAQGNRDTFIHSITTVNGNSIPTETAIVELGYYNGYDGALGTTHVNVNSDPSIQKYLDIFKAQGVIKTQEAAIGMELYKTIKAYQQAEDSGALSNPAVKQLVQGMTQNIVTLSDVVQDAYANRPLGEIQGSIHASLTHASSGGICTAGQRQDSGIQCL